MEVIKNDSVAEIIELDVQSLCRLCGSMNVNLLPIFDQTNSNDIPSKIVDYLGFSVDANDPLPHHVCIHCTISLLTWHSFYQSCSKTNIKFQQMLVNDSVEQKIDFSQNEAVQLLEEEEFCQELEEPEKDLIEQENIEYFNQEEEEMPENHDMPVEEDQVLDNEEDLLVTKDDLPIESEPEPENNEEEKKTRTKRKLPRLFKGDKKKRRRIPLTMHGCQFCDELVSFFATQEELNDHLRSDHRDKVFECEMCELLVDIQQLMEHMLDHAREAEETLEEEVLETVKTSCGKYKCNQCDKSYAHRSGYYVHLNKVHKTQEQYQFPCPNCPKTFSYKWVLNEHIKNIHNRIRDHNCDQCKSTFKTNSSLYIHKKLIHNPKYSFCCNLCDQKFKLQHELHRHTKTKHLNRKEFVCKTCGKAFNLLNHLTKHMKTHSAVDSFKCDLCSYKTKQKRYLVCHIKRLH